MSGQLVDARASLEFRKAKPSFGAQEFDHASNVQCSAEFRNGSLLPIEDIGLGAGQDPVIGHAEEMRFLLEAARSPNTNDISVNLVAILSGEEVHIFH